MEESRREGHERIAHSYLVAHHWNAIRPHEGNGSSVGPKQEQVRQRRQRHLPIRLSDDLEVKTKHMGEQSNG